MPRTNAICPNCGKKMKYLFELVYRSKDTAAGKKSNIWYPTKRAIYCNVCDDIYKMELENDLSQLKTDLSDLRQKATEKFKIQ